MSRSSSISARRTGSAGAASSSSECLPIDSSSSARLTSDAILRPTPPLCIACILTAAACLSASAAAVSTSVSASSSTSSSSTDWSTAAASTMRSTTASTSPSNGVRPSQPRRRVSSSRVGILPRRPAAVKRLYLRRRVLLLRSLLADGPAARDGLYPYRGLFPGSHLGSSGSSAMRRLNHNRGVVLRRLHLDLQDQVVEELVDVHIVADVRLGRVRGGLR